MNDRELLEMAAKAAGYEVKPHPNHRLCSYLVFVVNGKNWNPLTDDGDALRLAVKLGIEFYQSDSGYDGEASYAGYSNGEEARTQYAIEYHNGEPYAATRRAIVRAAAEIGKELQC